MEIRTAILIDGGFYRKRSLHLAGPLTAKERADELSTYCYRHIKDQYLYRIFYYDCPPLDKVFYHPLKKEQIDFKQQKHYQWTLDFFNELKQKRKFALRFGKREEKSTAFTLKPNAVKKLLNRTVSVDELTEEDFTLNIGQKGVDMRIGLDIASLSHKKLVNQIILISGDSDFVPAAKHARREGIDFILDSMGQPINDDLFEHIDGLNSHWKELKKKHKR